MTDYWMIPMAATPVCLTFFAVELQWIAAALAVMAVVALLLWGLSRLLKRTRQTVEAAEEPELIDVGSLPATPPPERGPRLTFYNLPVRLAVLVMAPAGRGAELPPKEQLPKVVDQLLPGLMQVLGAHQPVYHSWPQQLSSGGFARTFARRVPLPGERGKGTPWCSLAGRFEADGRIYLAGMVLCAAAPNSFAHIEIEKPGGWLDALRIIPLDSS